jgi:hypothetical protein
MLLFREAGSRAVLLAVASCLAGCGEDAQFESQTTRRTAPPRAPIDADAMAASFDHMLTAIIPQPGPPAEAWFLKATASRSRLEKLRPAWEELLSSLQFAEGDRRLTWKLPDGWTEREGDAMRVATLAASVDGQECEVTVTRLPMTGTLEEFLEPNVNRWLGQLQQAPLAAAVVAQLAQPRMLAGQASAVVELRGFLPTSPRSADRPAAAAAATPGESTEARQQAPLSFQAPEGWRAGPLSAARLAAFSVADAGSSAEVTITAFPAPVGSGMADPLLNAERWAGQVGLGDLGRDALQAMLRGVPIGGQEGSRIDLLGAAEDPAAKGMLVAMVQRRERVYFFKMFGPRATVDSQRDEFDAFLQSIAFRD